MKVRKKPCRTALAMLAQNASGGAGGGASKPRSSHTVLLGALALLAQTEALAKRKKDRTKQVVCININKHSDYAPRDSGEP